MTLDEKVGQLVQYSAGNATGPASDGISFRELIAKGQLGSLLNVTGAAETNALQRIAMTQSRLKIPLLFGLDVIHGYRTIFPVPLGMAATWDPSLVERASRIAAEEATAEGIRWTFSPMVDIARDARWGRIVEGAGEDPYLGKTMAAAYVHGYQGTISRIAIRWRLAQSIWPGMARPKVAVTTMQLIFLNARCGKFICRRFSQQSTVVRLR